MAKAESKPKIEHAEDSPLRLEWRSPAELAENPRNWRRHPETQLSALSDVIGEVGWAGACLYNETTSRLIDGHARRKVALDQGTTLIPVLVGRWTPEQEAKILATLDPLAAMAEADSAALNELLKEVSTNSESLREMMKGLAEANPLPIEPGDGGDEFDTTPEASGPTRTQLGDLWIIGGKHRLMVGDCTDAGTVLLLMNGVTWNCAVTDPPYGVDYEGGRNPDTNSPREKITNDSDPSIYARFLPVLDSVRAKKGVLYIWFASSKGLHVFNAINASGFDVRALIIWNKIDAHYGNFMAQYMNKHEPCLYCVKDGSEWNGPTNEVTVWDIKQPSRNEYHPTQKPIELMARAIKNSTSHGQIVYDPFLGSGTTLIAAHRLGRVCYGCELEPKYADVILKRCEAEGLTATKES